MAGPTPFLLIHGGSHGAWCWRKTQEALSALDQPSHAFDLPGAGADQTARANVNFQSYVDAAIYQIDHLPAGTVRVVGHSIAGMLLPTIAAARPHRVAEIVYVAAVALPTGMRCIDAIPESRRAGYFVAADAASDGTLTPHFQDAWNRFFPSLDEQQARAAFAAFKSEAQHVGR